MIRVKFTSNFAYSPFLRQTPGSSGRWDDYQFYVNDDTTECDWWIVYEGIDKSETVRCPKDRTVFFTDEPPTVKRYNKKFLSQFHTVITCQRDMDHPNVINTHTAHPWMVGCSFVLGSKGTLEKDCAKDYDELKDMILPLKKDKLISVVSSNKESTPGHKQRLKFVNELKRYLGDKVDVYGRGIRDFADKWDVIAPYKYHIAVENTSYLNYYSEKLVDTYMAGAYPIYYGCPNINKYFPKDALLKIDINDIPVAINLIEKCLYENSYEKNINLIKRSRDLLLDEYNIFPFLIKEVFPLRNNIQTESQTISLTPERVFNSTLFQMTKRHIKKFLRI